MKKIIGFICASLVGFSAFAYDIIEDTKIIPCSKILSKLFKWTTQNLKLKRFITLLHRLEFQDALIKKTDTETFFTYNYTK